MREGWALDYRRYSTDYPQAESAAKRAGAGIWRGEFTSLLGVARGTPLIGGLRN